MIGSTYLPTLRFRVNGLAWRALIAIGLIGLQSVPAYAQSAWAKNERADWEWARNEGSAMLVLRPAALAGVTRWAMESPRHRGSILCMAPSADGKRVATGGVDGVVRIWNLESGTFEKAFAGHTYHLHSMAWSPDGEYLATNAWGDAYLRIWETNSGKMYKQFRTRLHLRSLCWSSDGKKLAAGTDGSGRIYVSEDFEEPEILTEVGRQVRYAQWIPESQRLIVSSVGNPMSVIDTEAKEELFRAEQPVDEATTRIRLSPDGTHFLANNVTNAAVFNSEDGKEILRVKTPCVDVVWSPDGTKFGTLSSVGLQLWNAEDGTAAEKIPITSGQLHWNPTNNRILAVSEQRIEVWSPEGKKPELSIDAGGAHAPIFQAGKPLITGVGTNELSLWDPVSFKRSHRLKGHTKPITNAVWSRDGKNFASAGLDGTVRLWDTKTGEQAHLLSGHKGAITCLDWSPDGKILASSGNDKTVRLWSSAGESLAVMEGHEKPIQALTWAPNGKVVATGGSDEVIRFWDSEKRTQVKVIECSSPISTMAWTTVKAGSFLAVGFQDAGIMVLNPASGQILHQVAPGRSTSWYRTSALSWLPAQQPMLLAGRFHLAQVWDINREQSVARQMAPGGASDVFPTAGGSIAVARAGDRTTRFWNPQTGELLGVLLEEGDCLIAISTAGDVKFDPAEKPNLIAIVETSVGQKTISLDELTKKHGWKNNARVMKLPTKN